MMYFEYYVIAIEGIITKMVCLDSKRKSKRKILLADFSREPKIGDKIWVGNNKGYFEEEIKVEK